MLISSERDFNRADVVVVDVAGPSLQVGSHAVGSGNIPAATNSGYFPLARAAPAHSKAVLTESGASPKYQTAIKLS